MAYRGCFKAAKNPAIDKLKSVRVLLEYSWRFLLRSELFGRLKIGLILKLNCRNGFFLVSLLHFAQPFNLILFVFLDIKALDNCPRRFTKSDFRIEVAVECKIHGSKMVRNVLEERRFSRFWRADNHKIDLLFQRKFLLWSCGTFCIFSFFFELHVDLPNGFANLKVLFLVKILKVFGIVHHLR